MFSHDEDEVNDLFQETLINMWKGIVRLLMPLRIY